MVHYICGYARDTDKNRWKYSPAGTAKMEYIMMCLDELKLDYRVYSTCQTITPKWFGEKSFGKIRYRSSFHTSNKYSFVFDRVLAIVLLLYYLLSVPTGDTVLVYHERFYLPWVNLAHRIKKWKLIWEVEEIYMMVHGNVKEKVEREIAGLSRPLAGNGGYILSTGLLKRFFSTNAIVCNGAYHPVYAEQGSLAEGMEPFHVVYGGTLNGTKGGAFAAAAATEYLDFRYHVHILGFGDDEQVQHIKELTDSINARSEASVSYDGCLKGEEYRAFLRKCHIGLSTQNPSSDYNDSSFPSKVLEYLRNGLNVVSIDIPAVRQSEVGDVLTYYERQTPEALAEAIKNAKFFRREEIEDILDGLHERFKQELVQLIRS